jgi:peptidoglycan/xylan/chitin deacetylase (PgdA/CDA1 family)
LGAVRRPLLTLALLLVVAAPAYGAPTVVSLEFDDGTADQAAALPLLAAHGFHATFYVPSGLVGTKGHLRWARLRAMQGAGHEIGGHTLHHTHLTALSDADARHEVCADRTRLRDHGLTATDFAYPYGLVDARIERIVAACGYRTARRVSGVACSGCPFAESLPPLDMLSTRTAPAVLRTTTASAIRQLVAGAQGHGGGWVQVIFHHVCSGCGRYAVTPAVLAGFLDWLASRTGVEVRTVAEIA